MQLYTYKDLDFGFIVLCPDQNIRFIKITLASLARNYPNRHFFCVTSEISNLEPIKEICPVFKGKNTYSSLINLGMKKATAEWNFLIVAGAPVHRKLDRKFSFFIDNERDILFPIVNGQCNFVDGTLNGLFMSKKTFKEIGNLPDTESMEICKLIWAAKAMENNCRFKAIQGTKVS